MNRPEGVRSAADVQAPLINLVAWVTIALGATGMLLPLAHSLFVRSSPPGEWRDWYVSLGPLSLLGLVVGTFTLFCGVGLRQRRSWARTLFRIELGLGVAVALIALLIEIAVLSSFEPERHMRPDQVELYRPAVNQLEFLRFVILAGTVVIGGIQAWLLALFGSDDVRSAFPGKVTAHTHGERSA